MRNIEKAKIIASKKYEKNNILYWKYVKEILSRLPEDLPTTPGVAPALRDSPYQSSTNMQKVPTIEDQLSSELDSKGVLNSDKIAKSSLELAQNRVPTNLQKNSPEYWPTVMNSAKELAGIQSDIQNPETSTTGKQNTSLFNKPSMFQSVESYVPFNKESKNQWVFTEETRAEAAKLLIKDMKDKNSTDNEIIHALVNRLSLDIVDAIDLIYKKKDIQVLPSDPGLPAFQDDSLEDTKSKIEKENKKLKEDNYYSQNRISVNNTNTNPSESYLSQRDKFEWALSSSKDRAEAIILENNVSYNVKLFIVQANSTRWPHDWMFLNTQHKVDTVLTVHIEQLTMDQNYIRPMNTPIPSGLYENIARTMVKILTSYQKIFGASHYQLVIFQTKNSQQIQFFDKVSKLVAKEAFGFVYDENLSAALTSTNSTKIQYFVIYNKQGKPIKESTLSEDDGVVMSSDVMDQLPAGKGSRGETGAQINAKAKRNLDKMLSGNLTVQMESKKTSSLLEKTKRMYFVKNNKTGQVLGFDNKDNADMYKKKYDAKALRAFDFFIKSAKKSPYAAADKVYLHDDEFSVDIQKNKIAHTPVQLNIDTPSIVESYCTMS